MVHLPPEQTEELIQYSEQGVFIDYIYRSELVAYIKKRIADGEAMARIGSPMYTAIYLGVHKGTHTNESLKPYLDSRIGSLKRRLQKLEE